MTDLRNLAPPPLPTSLHALLVGLRKRLWTTKTLEAVFAALAGLLASYLLVFALDRFVETPAAVRLALLVAGLAGGVLLLPLQLVRWVGRHASLLQVARRVAREDLRRGDELLCVLELTQDAEEFRRSPDLARAAVAQGAERLEGVDLSHTLPRSRHRGFGALAAGALVLTAGVAVAVPAAGGNAFLRWLLPLGDVDRYTFARLEGYAEDRVVPRFEPFVLELALDESTRRRPESAKLALDGADPVTATRVDDRYRFELDALSEPASARLFVGDHRGRLTFEPLDRPEVETAQATVALPAYLELPTPLSADVRGGSVGVVEDSAVSLAVTASRALASAGWSSAGDDVATAVDGPQITTAPLTVAASRDSQLVLTDVHGLEGTAPFQLALRARADGEPTVVIDGLQSDTILLHDQAAVFGVIASDDFGARRVGLEWRGVGDREGAFRRAEGEKLLGVGDPDAARLELRATLHPALLDIDPQVLELRAWVLDALPGRERVYSGPVTVQVMTEDDHMIWLTRALAGWYDEAVEVRDEEHNLLKTNEALNRLSDDELVAPEVQRKLQTQAAAERLNGRRLGRLVANGSELLEEAARNPQFNSNTLDDWAEMMSTLRDISQEGMPSVASLLSEAARAEEARPLPQPMNPALEQRLANERAGMNRSTSKPSGPSGAEPSGAEPSELQSDPQVSEVESDFDEPGEPGPASAQRRANERAGLNRSTPEPSDAAGAEPSELPSAPQVSDVESDFNEAGEADPQPEEGEGGASPPASLGLAETVVQGGGEPGDPPPGGGDAEAPPTPTRAELAAAIEAQRALMEEFQSVAGEISEILANLEGSTFVKRLKALSRLETGVAQDLDGTLVQAFGARDEPDRLGIDAVTERVVELQAAAASRASSIREDLGAYVQRLEAAGRSAETFSEVRTEMGELRVARELDVVGDLAALSRTGEAGIGAEILADHLDRWAEILVGPG